MLIFQIQKDVLYDYTSYATAAAHLIVPAMPTILSQSKYHMKKTIGTQYSPWDIVH